MINFLSRKWYAIIDIALPLVLALAAAVLTFTHLAEKGPWEFYEGKFAPAVILACTGKLQNVDVGLPELAALRHFLDRTTDELDCRDLPPINPTKFNKLQGTMVYLLGLTGITWSAVGVSWSRLTFLAAMLAGLYAATIYAVCRLFVAPILSAAVATLCILSPLHLWMLPHLRDYSKAPFLLLFIGLTGYWLKRLAAGRRVLLAAALAGLAAGVGFGFRTDLAATVPFFGLVAAAGAITRLARPSHILASCAAFLGGFLVAATPPLTLSYAGGGAMGHVFLLGLTDPHSTFLELTLPIYSFGPLYSDLAIDTLIRQFALQQSPPHEPYFQMLDSEYARYSLKLVLSYLIYFPADALMRVFSSIIHVADAAISWQVDVPLPPFVKVIRTSLLEPKSGIIFVSLAVLCLLLQQRFLGLYFGAIVVFFGGVTAVQFQFRHIFQMEFVYWCSLAILISTAAFLASQYILRLSRSELHRSRGESLSVDDSQSKLKITAPIFGFLVFVGAGVAAFSIFKVMEAYQHWQVAKLIRTYLAAPRESVDVARSLEGDSVLFRPRGEVSDFNGRRVKVDRDQGYFYFVVSIIAKSCRHSRLPLRISYQRKDSFDDLSQDITVPLGQGGKVTVFVPVVSRTSRIIFDGFKIPHEQEACQIGIEAIARPSKLPLPLWLVLPDGWENLPMYPRLRLESLSWIP